MSLVSGIIFVCVEHGFILIISSSRSNQGKSPNFKWPELVLLHELRNLLIALLKMTQSL